MSSHYYRRFNKRKRKSMITYKMEIEPIKEHEDPWVDWYDNGGES